jgi:hypothetical protein
VLERGHARLGRTESVARTTQIKNKYKMTISEFKERAYDILRAEADANGFDYLEIVVVFPHSLQKEVTDKLQTTFGCSVEFSTGKAVDR